MLSIILLWAYGDDNLRWQLWHRRIDDCMTGFVRGNVLSVPRGDWLPAIFPRRVDFAIMASDT